MKKSKSTPQFFFLFLFVFFSSIGFAQQKNAPSSLWNAWSNKSNSDTVRVTAIDDLAWSYLNINLDSAFIFSELELKFAKDKKLKKWEALALNTQGLICRYKGDNLQALELFGKSLAIRTELNDKNGMASCYANISNAYGQMSDYPRALEHTFKALAIFEEIGNKVGQAKAQSDIAIYYSTMGDSPKALKYFMSSLKLSEEIKDDYSIALASGNIGMIYIQRGKPDNALPFLIRGQLIDEKIGNMYGLIVKSVSISMIYRDLGEYEKALKEQDKAFKLCEQINYKEGFISSEVNYGYIYYYLKEYKKSIIHFEKGKSLAIESGDLRNKKDCYKGLYLAKKGLGNFESAIADYESYNKLNDSIYKEENVKEATKKEFQYTYEKKVAADSVKAIAEKKVINAQLKQEQTQRYALYGGLFLMVVFAGFIFNRFKLSQKQKSIIEMQKHIVDEKQKEIIDSITYARRIQKSLLPTERYIDSSIKRLTKK